MTRVAAVLVAVVALVAPAVSGAAWTQQPGPVLTGNRDNWEHGIIGEPTVLYLGGRYRMWYTAGYSDHNALGYATSSDGVRWVKRPQPVLGQGASGFTGNVTHTNVVHYRGLFYAYFNQDATSLGHVDPALYLATSSDGVRWKVQSAPVVTAGSWDNSLANSFEWVDKTGWHMVYEAMDEAAGAGGRYLIGLASSRDGVRWQKTAGPLLALRHGSGMTGGPWVVHGRGGFTLYYHASLGDGSGGDVNLPTDIYAAHSTNLLDWTSPAAPVVGRDFPAWQAFQVADPSVVTAHGRTLMFFAAWSSTAGGIGVATLSG